MFSKYFSIEKRSHHFLITDVQGRAREVIENFAKQYIQYKFNRIRGKWRREAFKIWASRTHDAREYRFHINQYNKFITHLESVGLSESLYTVKQALYFETYSVSFEVRPHFVERDYQIPIVEYLCDYLNPPLAKMLEIQTGRGKTFCALKAGEKVGQRIMAVLKPTYMDKWVSDFTNIYDMEPDRVWSITGAKNLKLLLKEAMNGTLDVDAIVISSHTLLSWIGDYNSMKPDVFALAGWPCCPDKLFEVTGTGLRIVDEAHQEFHLGFMIDLFTHVPLSISLSATMKSDDQFTNQMYELVYPKALRYANLPYIRFIHSYAWKYRFENDQKLCYSYPGATTYSHNAFEESILKNPMMLQSYLEFIGHVVRHHYLEDDYQPGDRCLVYASSIHMCDIIHKYLKKIFSGMDVRRYVDDDPYDNLMQAEVCVSTVGSAGTGHDISKLTTVVLTPAIKSTQSNIQGFGRLRETIGRKMKFVYFVCLDSDKHVEYHHEKTSLLKSRALTHQEREHMSLLRCK